MKRFYKNAAWAQSDAGYQLTLDLKPVKTPLKNKIIVPSQALAEALAAEWNAQKDEISPKSMPFNQLVNTMLDNVLDKGRRDQMSAEILRFVESDLIFYYAEHPEDLVKRQQKLWQPIQSWFETTYDIDVKTSAGIIYVEQDAALAMIAADALDDLTAEEFTAYQSVVGPLGSLIIALAFIKGEITAQVAHDSAFVDEIYQTEQWGVDKEAAQQRKNILEELQTVNHFLELSR